METISKAKGELISRPVPAIVSEQDWDKAQQTLISNRILSPVMLMKKYFFVGLVKSAIYVV